jgi:hypothetical protein
MQINMSQDTAYQTIKYLQERVQTLQERNELLQKLLNEKEDEMLNNLFV